MERLLREEVDGAEVKRIEDLSGQDLFACYQCGKCSAGCPSAPFMDLLPHMVIRLLQMGKVAEVLEASSPWLCACCEMCATRCPRGVDVTRVMEAVRLIQLRQNRDRVHPTALPKEKLQELPQIALVGNFRKMTA